MERLQLGDLVLIDVRPGGEYSAGHIPGAISVIPNDWAQLDKHLETIPPELDIVAYCRGPYCVYADDAIRHLATRGRPAIRLEEGIPDWQRQGGPVEI